MCKRCSLRQCWNPGRQNIQNWSQDKIYRTGAFYQNVKRNQKLLMIHFCNSCSHNSKFFLIRGWVPIEENGGRGMVILGNRKLFTTPTYAARSFGDPYASRSETQKGVTEASDLDCHLPTRSQECASRDDFHVCDYCKRATVTTMSSKSRIVRGLDSLRIKS